jgi:hypothetical protein
MPVAKRNKYRKTFVTIDGEPIIGLKRRPNQGRFYLAIDPNVTFGREPVEAVRRFAAWKRRNKRRYREWVVAYHERHGWPDGKIPKDLRDLAISNALDRLVADYDPSKIYIPEDDQL